MELKCSAMLQKELVDKLVDEACGDDVKDGHAGLCEYELLNLPAKEKIIFFFEFFQEALQGIFGRQNQQSKA